MWDNADDAAMRINNSVVRYNDGPVYVTAMMGDEDTLAVGFIDLLNGNNEVARITDPLWDWSPVPLGFVNLDRRMMFAYRVPCRKWKQGLHKDNLEIYPHDIDTDALLRSRNIARTIQRDYPSFEECYNIPKGESRAFHPDFGIERVGLGVRYLKYRSDAVGWYEKNKLVLADEYTYLKELTEEVQACCG